MKLPETQPPPAAETDPSLPRSPPSSARSPEPTPAHLLADNLFARIREIAGIVCYLLLARWGLIDGQWAAGLIAATVLPIELTRQLVKPAVARRTAGGLGGGGALLLLAGAVYKAQTGLTTLPLVATLAVTFVGCSDSLRQRQATAAHPSTNALHRALPPPAHGMAPGRAIVSIRSALPAFRATNVRLGNYLEQLIRESIPRT
jgi:hypothetical protein